MKVQINQHWVFTVCKTLTVVGVAIDRKMYKIFIKYYHWREEYYVQEAQCPQLLHLEYWGNPSTALPSFFLIQVELFRKENKRAIENSSASREYKFSSELLKILHFLNK